MSDAQPTQPPDEMDNMFATVWVKVEIAEPDSQDGDFQEESQSHEESQGHEELSSPALTLRGRKRTSKRPRSPKPRAQRGLNPRPKDLQCDQCDYKTAFKNCLRFHIMSHTNTKPFSCNLCDYTTKYPTSLSRHILGQHEIKADESKKEKMPTFSCLKCDYTTIFKWNLAAHMRKHNSVKKFKCPKCDFATAYRHNYDKHSRSHNKETTSFHCDKCPFVTKYEGHISRHLAKIHNEVSDKANMCDYCNFSTKTKWRLNVHKNRMRREKDIKCPYCPFETSYMCAYKMHKASHTDKHGFDIEKNAIIDKNGDSYCVRNPNFIPAEKENESSTQIDEGAKQMVENNDETGMNVAKEMVDNNESQSDYFMKSFEDDDERLSPERPHQSFLVDKSAETDWHSIHVKENPGQERPFQCINCDYTAKFKASVQRHFQRLHTSTHRPYKCINCDFSTKTRDQIALHNKRSKSEIQLDCTGCNFSTFFKCQYVLHQKCHNPHKCKFCDYTCRQKYDMQKHYTGVHLGNGGIKCQYCDYRACRKDTMLSHEAIHTGEKPFNCDLCDYSSVRRSLLQNHKRRKHTDRNAAPVIIDDSKLESLKKPIEMHILNPSLFYETITQ